MLFHWPRRHNYRATRYPTDPIDARGTSVRHVWVMTVASGCYGPGTSVAHAETTRISATTVCGLRTQRPDDRAAGAIHHRARSPGKRGSPKALRLRHVQPRHQADGRTQLVIHGVHRALTGAHGGWRRGHKHEPLCIWTNKERPMLTLDKDERLRTWSQVIAKVEDYVDTIADHPCAPSFDPEALRQLGRWRPHGDDVAGTADAA